MKTTNSKRSVSQIDKARILQRKLKYHTCASGIGSAFYFYRSLSEKNYTVTIKNLN